MRHPSLPAAALATVLTLGLGACADDAPEQSTAADVQEEGQAADEQPASEEAAGDEAADDTAGGEPAEGDDALEDAGAGVLVQFRGEQLTAGQDSTFWSCATSADGGFASVMFLDEAGNDVSISYDANAGTNATLTLTDGTTWNQTEGGVANVSQQADGAYRMSIQVTEIDTGETESMDVRLSCG